MHIKKAEEKRREVKRDEEEGWGEKAKVSVLFRMELEWGYGINNI